MFWLISAFFFSYFFVIGIYVIFLPKILQELGYTSLQIGIIFSTAPLIRFLIPFFFLKRFSLDERVLNLSLFTLFFSALSFYFTIENFYPFLFSMIFYSLSSSLILPIVETFSLEYLKKEFYGRARLFGSIGFMIAGLVLAKILSSYVVGIHFMFIFLVFTILITVLIERRKIKPGAYKKERDFGKFDLGKDIGFWINIFLMQMSFGAFYNFFTIFESEHGVGLKDVSYLWAFSIVCEVLIFYFQAFFLKTDLRYLVAISTLITSFRWLLIHLFPSFLPVLYFSQSLHAVSFALYHTAALSYLYTIYENKNLASQFYYGFGFGLGGFAGSLISGYLYGENIFLYASLIAFGGYLAMFFLKRE